MLNPIRGVYTRYIPSMYCTPPRYISPTTCDRNQKNAWIVGFVGVQDIFHRADFADICSSRKGGSSMGQI